MLHLCFHLGAAVWARCKKCQPETLRLLSETNKKKRKYMVLITGNALNIRTNDQIPVCVFFNDQITAYNLAQ